MLENEKWDRNRALLAEQVHTLVSNEFSEDDILLCIDTIYNSVTEFNPNKYEGVGKVGGYGGGQMGHTIKVCLMF